MTKPRASSLCSAASTISSSSRQIDARRAPQQEGAPGHASRDPQRSSAEHVTRESGDHEENDHAVVTAAEHDVEQRLGQHAGEQALLLRHVDWMCSSTTHSTAQPRKASIAGVRCASMLMCAKAADGRLAGMGSRVGCAAPC